MLALGWQARPDLNPTQMRELLFKSARKTTEGAVIINPPEFINLVKMRRRLRRSLRRDTGGWIELDKIMRCGLSIWLVGKNLNDHLEQLRTRLLDVQTIRLI